VRFRRRVPGLVLVVAATLVVANMDAPASSSALAATAGEPGVTNTEIRVGGVASTTNPLGGDYGDGFAGVKAYFDYVNSRGGIYGRKLSLVSERDDKVGSNRQEVQGLISEDDLFAVLPVEVLLFTGADLLARSGIPTFGWNINAEWGSEQAPGPVNLFGEKGSYLCFTCANPVLPWLAQRIHARRVGLLAYQNPSSSACAEGVQASLRKYPSAKLVFVDSSLSFGVTDLTGDVSEMKSKNVDLVSTCMDNNGTLTLAKEMRKEGLNAPQYLPNAYNQKFMRTNAQFYQGSYVLTFFTPFEVKHQPPGLKLFLKWTKKSGSPQNENALAGWINADLFYQGLKGAGPDFTQQRVIDAINKMTDYTAGGILGGINWQIQHSGENPLNCQVISKVHNGTFVPSFGTDAEPFVCFPPHPERLPAEPTLK
jgi:branched-chain amino acid transport system substrate-binding protein